MNESVLMAAVAGLCGAIGAVSGKLAFDEKMNGITTASCFIVFILSNITMWATYTRSLALSHSSSTPLIINMSFNFSVTGILGKFIFNESHDEIWWFFLCLLVIGLILLLSYSTVDNEEKDD